MENSEGRMISRRSKNAIEKRIWKSFLSKEREYVDTGRRTSSFKMLSNFVMLLLEKL